MQLNRLEGFYWVARAGGYAAASRAFPYPITQPALHQQVRGLEAELGVRLFSRGPSGRVRLSSAGQSLFDVVAPFFTTLGDVVRGLKIGEASARLSVRATSQAIQHLLPAWMARLRRIHPRFRLELCESRAQETAGLLAGDVDLWVDFVPSLPAGLAWQRIATYETFLALPADHPQARNPRVRLADLRGTPFVAYGAGTRHEALQLKALAIAGVHPSEVSTADSTEGILGMVASGVGFSVVGLLRPQAHRNRNLRLVAVNNARARFPFYVLWSPRTQNPLVTDAVRMAPEAVLHGPSVVR
jgi:DNA-binding transcriptional LysR family regulator